jgi:hypothetical protein
MTSVTHSLEKAVSVEIEALHTFFVSWFGGQQPSSESGFETGLTSRLDKDFILIQPSGATLDRDELLTAIQSGYGSNPEFRIAIRAVVIRRVFDTLVLATYEEWQRNAKASQPSDNGRVASVLFRRDHDRLRWLHVHETWLPRDMMEAGCYDF